MAGLELRSPNWQLSALSIEESGLACPRVAALTAPSKSEASLPDVAASLLHPGMAPGGLWGPGAPWEACQGQMASKVAASLTMAQPQGFAAH